MRYEWPADALAVSVKRKERLGVIEAEKTGEKYKETGWILYLGVTGTPFISQSYTFESFLKYEGKENRNPHIHASREQTERFIHVDWEFKPGVVIHHNGTDYEYVMSGHVPGAEMDGSWPTLEKVS
jgi:hypothetical protein